MDEKYFILNNRDKNIKTFVDKAIIELNLPKLYKDYLENGGICNGENTCVYLIKNFLNLNIDYDNTNVEEPYKNIKKVKDLPEEDIKRCLWWLSFILGATEHTGGFNFYEMYIKHIKK